MKSCIFAWVACFVIATAALASPEEAHPDAFQRINLEQIDSFEHFFQSSVLLPPEVAFIDNDRLAVTFLNPCPESPGRLSLKSREEPGKPCGLVITVLMVDITTDHIEQSLTLPFHPQAHPSAGEFRHLLPTQLGEFVIHTGDFVVRFNPKLEVIEKRAISTPNRTVLFASPSGTLLLLNEFEAVGKFRKFVLPSDNIQAGRLFGVGWPGEGVMDDGTVLSHIWNVNPKLSDSLRQEKCSLKWMYCVAACDSEDDCHLVGGPLWLVNETTFVAKIPGMIRHANKFAIVDRNGKVLYVGNTSDPIHGFAAGPSGTRKLVIMSGRAKLTHGGAVTRFGFDVFDLRDMKVAMRVALQSIGMKHGNSILSRNPDATISPDGSKVAILVGSELRLYQIPRDHN